MNRALGRFGLLTLGLMVAWTAMGLVSGTTVHATKSARIAGAAYNSRPAARARDGRRDTKLAPRERWSSASRVSATAGPSTAKTSSSHCPATSTPSGRTSSTRSRVRTRILVAPTALPITSPGCPHEVQRPGDTGAVLHARGLPLRRRGHNQRALPAQDSQRRRLRRAYRPGQRVGPPHPKPVGPQHHD